jgi:O-antigen/teichoic acid export membrane protein
MSAKPGTGLKLVRQSSLLLVGRIISKLANFATQILIVRYLSQTTYGGFAYALTVATTAQNLVALGLDRSIVRFLPIFQEQRDYPKLFGTIVMAVLVIVSLGLVMALALFGLQGFLGAWVPNKEMTMPLLLILIFLAPLQALDDLLVGMFAVFAKARSIFIRRFLLAPVLRLTVVGTMILTQGDVFLLAWGYVASSLLGLTIYGYLLLKVLRQEGLLAKWSIHKLERPWRQVLGFTLPLLTTDLTYAAMNTLSVVVLGHYWGTTGVAALTAVQPTARMNELVLNTFGILYVPVAARMFANQDRTGINALYWRTAIWIAILSFPLFALTFSLARPLTLILFGSRYLESAPILALLALGHYFNAALGHNGLTLKVFGKVRALVLINLATIASSVLLSLILIPRLGAIGAGIAIMGTLVIHNLLKQTGLKFGTGVRLFEAHYLKAFAGIVLCAAGLFAVQLMTSSVYVNVGLAALATWLLIRMNSGLLEIGETFPEAMRSPLIRLLLGRRRQQGVT